MPIVSAIGLLLQAGGKAGAVRPDSKLRWLRAQTRQHECEGLELTPETACVSRTSSV